jgi:hypothetical protein
MTFFDQETDERKVSAVQGQFEMLGIGFQGFDFGKVNPSSFPATQSPQCVAIQMTHVWQVQLSAKAIG